MPSQALPEEVARGLREVAGLRAIANIQRLAVLVALHLAGRLTFTELSRVTGIGKGSLEHHLKVLEEEGLVKRNRHLTLLGPRVFIGITSKGSEVVRKSLKLFKGIEESAPTGHKAR